MNPQKQLAGSHPHDRSHAPWWTAQWPLLTAIAWLVLLLTASIWWWLERDSIGQRVWQSPAPIVEQNSSTPAAPQITGSIDIATNP